MQEATDTTHHDEPSFGVFHTTEESIELETLEVLYRSPSDEIRGAAIKIVVERIYKNSDVDSPWNVLLFDIRTNTKSARQHKALAILRFLNESHDGSEVAQERFSRYGYFLICLPMCLSNNGVVGQHLEHHHTIIDFRSLTSFDLPISL